MINNNTMVKKKRSMDFSKIEKDILTIQNGL